MSLSNWTTRFLVEAEQGEETQIRGQGVHPHESASEGISEGDSSPGESPQSFVGSRVGPYLITKRLGEGGVGEVFKGIDVMLKREVAIKVLRSDLAADPVFLERFRQEAQLQAKLSHLNVASIHAFVHEGDKQFIVMEYVAGISLDEFVRSGGPVAVERALDIFRRTLDGIEHAHRCGIIHRDIKPANIMLADNGQIKVMDFGIARALDSQEHLTRHGQVPGTAKSMSPEQIRGGQADIRSDIYSLGILLYTLLAGRAPFNGDTDFAMMKCQLEQQPPPLRGLIVSIPPKVEAAVMRALEKDPSARFQNVREFSRVIDECLAELGKASPASSSSSISISTSEQQSSPMESRTKLNPALQQSQTSMRTKLNPALEETDPAMRTVLNPQVLLANSSAQTVLNPDLLGAQESMRAYSASIAAPVAATFAAPLSSPLAPTAGKQPRQSAVIRKLRGMDRRVGVAAVAVIAIVSGIVQMWPRLSAHETTPLASALVASPQSVAESTPALPTAVTVTPRSASVAPTVPVATTPQQDLVAAQPAPPQETTVAAAPRTLSIARLSSNGKAVAAGPGFKPGEQVKLLITPSSDAHVYCYLQDESRRVLRFYPNRFNESALVKAQAPLEIPGKMRFEIVANKHNVIETVACFASTRELTAELPADVVGKDFANLQATSLDQVRNSFARVDAALTEASFRVNFK